MSGSDERGRHGRQERYNRFHAVLCPDEGGDVLRGRDEDTHLCRGAVRLLLYQRVCGRCGGRRCG